ncbi:hypothetical protein DXN04_29345 [Chitinophaga silvisoli]|uniref:Uncharacterized protein n=1 Tax=Chitinophaga silvisoli TaxID=2291814 RepID=A0A3E1NU15_9BACT|nr:hypothetical protein DXN04_29345 [Chitinophaga silvisoli]
MRLTIENQEVVLYIDESVAYGVMVVDLDSVYSLGDMPLARHIIMICLLSGRDIDFLYRLGKIIQSKFPASILSIDWLMTYYFVEFEDYISN